MLIFSKERYYNFSMHCLFIGTVGSILSSVLVAFIMPSRWYMPLILGVSMYFMPLIDFLRDSSFRSYVKWWVMKERSEELAEQSKELLERKSEIDKRVCEIVKHMNSERNIKKLKLAPKLVERSKELEERSKELLERKSEIDKRVRELKECW